MDSSITLDQVLREMERKDRKGQLISFVVTVITCDLDRVKGGERITYNATLHSPGGKKKAYHTRNDSRNIKLLRSDEVRAIHPILITSFNGRSVII